MEEIHSRFLITDELKLYTLATVMFEPDRLANQFGVDPFSAVDKEARWNFWQGFANEMPLDLPADNREDFLDWMIQYEAENYAYTPDAEGCFDALVEDWKRWYPTWVPQRDKLARQSLVGLLDDQLRETMGQELPPAFVRQQVKLVAQTYLRSTNYRVFRRNRNLIKFFGKNLAHPRNLDTVGHKGAPAKKVLT
jgi:hypothetical protein